MHEQGFMSVDQAKSVAISFLGQFGSAVSENDRIDWNIVFKNKLTSSGWNREQVLGWALMILNGIVNTEMGSQPGIWHMEENKWFRYFASWTSAGEQYNSFENFVAFLRWAV